MSSKFLDPTDTELPLDQFNDLISIMTTLKRWQKDELLAKKSETETIEPTSACGYRQKHLKSEDICTKILTAKKLSQS